MALWDWWLQCFSPQTDQSKPKLPTVPSLGTTECINKVNKPQQTQSQVSSPGLEASCTELVLTATKSSNISWRLWKDQWSRQLRTESWQRTWLSACWARWTSPETNGLQLNNSSRKWPKLWERILNNDDLFMHLDWFMFGKLVDRINNK